MHFKRKRAKSARAGCLLCKPHKGNGMCADHKNMKHGNRRRYLAGADQLRCEGLRADQSRPLDPSSDLEFPW